MQRTRTPFRLFALGLALAGGLAACGGDDDTDVAASTAEDTSGTTGEDTTGGTSPNGAEGVVGDPITVEALTTCLEGAGLTVQPDNDAVMLGVEDPYYQMAVELEPEGTDSELSATFYVFDAPELAEEYRVNFTLQTEDDDRNKLVENVVLSYSIIPSYDKEGSAAVESCLPPS
jgi:hypothetical protein